jgi:hypothetical protein
VEFGLIILYRYMWLLREQTPESQRRLDLEHAQTDESRGLGTPPFSGTWWKQKVIRSSLMDSNTSSASPLHEYGFYCPRVLLYFLLVDRIQSRPIYPDFCSSDYFRSYLNVITPPTGRKCVPSSPDFAANPLAKF